MKQLLDMAAQQAIADAEIRTLAEHTLKEGLKEFVGQEDTEEMREKIKAKIKELAEEQATDDAAAAERPLGKYLRAQAEQHRTGHPGSKRRKMSRAKRKAQRQRQKNARRNR